MFSNESSKDWENYEMNVFIDSRYANRVQKQFYPNTRITLIEIDDEFMERNLHMWKTLPREREIMNSTEFKNKIPHRIHFPEHSIPEYSLINHCKIDFINYVILNNISDAEYFCWVDFGFFKIQDSIPPQFLDLEKLNLDKINYTLINKLDFNDISINYTLKHAPEKVGGFFFFGSKKKMIEYQKLYHSMLDYYQNNLKICDDDQALALACLWKNPQLFCFHFTGVWHIALKYFSK